MKAHCVLLGFVSFLWASALDIVFSIEAVEQSQMRQMAAAGSRLMGMLTLDESNALYQSFRSKTAMGLEIGSLVAGGYGMVKGVIAFNRLAKVSNTTDQSCKIWQPT